MNLADNKANAILQALYPFGYGLTYGKASVKEAVVNKNLQNDIVRESKLEEEMQIEEELSYRLVCSSFSFYFRISNKSSVEY